MRLFSTSATLLALLSAAPGDFPGTECHCASSVSKGRQPAPVALGRVGWSGWIGRLDPRLVSWINRFKGSEMGDKVVKTFAMLLMVTGFFVTMPAMA
jgi:hypothetical protein